MRHNKPKIIAKYFGQGRKLLLSHTTPPTQAPVYEVRFSLLESDGWARRNLKIKKYANKQTVTNAQHSHAQPT
jgi:hypothetical protein